VTLPLPLPYQCRFSAIITTVNVTLCTPVTIAYRWRYASGNPRYLSPRSCYSLVIVQSIQLTADSIHVRLQIHPHLNPHAHIVASHWRQEELVFVSGAFTGNEPLYSVSSTPFNLSCHVKFNIMIALIVKINRCGLYSCAY